MKSHLWIQRAKRSLVPMETSGEHISARGLGRLFGGRPQGDVQEPTETTQTNFPSTLLTV